MQTRIQSQSLTFTAKKLEVLAVFLTALAVGFLACDQLFEALEIQARGCNIVFFVVLKFGFCLVMASPFAIFLGAIKDKIKTDAASAYWTPGWFVTRFTPFQQFLAGCPAAFFRPPRLFL